MAKNLTLDGTDLSASNQGGVAVLDQPITAAAPVAAPVIVKPKRTRKPRQQPAGEIKSAEARASVMAQDGVADATAGIKAIDAAKDVNVHDSTLNHDQRKFLRHASLDVLTGVGLGNKSGGYGPYVRTVVIALLGVLLGKTESLKTGRRTVTKEEITQVSIRSVLCLADFQVQALATLAKHLAGLKPDASGDALKTRTKNEKLAKDWITTGMHASYVTAIDKIGEFGGECDLGNGIKMPLDWALRLSYGRNLTAKDANKSNKEAMAILKVSMATAAPTTPAQPTVAPVVAPALVTAPATPAPAVAA
jgi:hypothetical protein